MKQKRRKQIKQSIAVLVSLSLFSVGMLLPVSHASAAKIKLNKTKLKLVAGKSYKLKLSKKKGKIKWTSSKKKIASVNAKGVVKAKKAGKATITATMKGKKYKCKVTVKKAITKQPTTAPKVTNSSKQTKTPSGGVPGSVPTSTPFHIPTPVPNNPTATPDAVNTEAPDISQEPDETPKPSSSNEPAFIPDLSELEQKITLESTLLSNHMLITVTNTNETWVDDVTIHYSYFDSYVDENGENNLLEIASGNESLGAITPGGKRYISLELSESFTSFDREASAVYPEAYEATDSYTYLDQKESVSITDTLDTKNNSLLLDIANSSRYSLDVPYAILFYDENKTKLIDAYTNTLKLDAKNKSNEIISLPVDTNTEEPVLLSDNYEIVYDAYTTEPIDDTTAYINNIKLTPQKITSSYTVFVDVTNNNQEWLSALDLEYHFYDEDDNFLIDGTAALQTMSPGETQTVPFNLDPQTIRELNFDHSFADINLQPGDPETQYGTTQNVSYTTTYNAEEDYYEITLRSTSRQKTEGTFLVKFYADTAKKELIGAELFDYSLASGETYTENVYGIAVKDENNISIDSLACDVTIQSRHTIP